MAGASLLALLDDIATVLDDVALMTRVAAKKTAGIVGDDLAVNAEQLTGMRAARELPVVWAVAKGSFVNKLILVPAALVLAAFAPWAILPLMVVGGLFLCFEGAEKVAHKLLHSKVEDAAEHAALRQAVATSEAEVMAHERAKIKGAIRTDFILSAEIIVIALGAIEKASLATQVLTLSVVAIAMTIGVYGLVAGIVKLDDAGLWLQRRPGALTQRVGRALVSAMPWLMRLLSVVGTLAMFTVGGGILTHAWPALHHAIEGLTAGLGGAAAGAVGLLADLAVGALAGLVVLGVVVAVKRLRRPSAAEHG
jgi:predicted DNA repair protein MutK